MDRTADLTSALSFVIARITDQALLSAQPLSDDQRMLLNYLPASPPAGSGDGETPVPRNFDYERLCALAKAAYLSDRQANPASLDWEFAFAVFTLNRHPMWGILKLAGMKPRRPLSDQLLLVFASLVFVVATISTLLGAEIHAWPRFVRLAVFLADGAIILLAYSASRRIEQRQSEQDIERCRTACRFVGQPTN